MGTYNIPRNVKGEGRILFVFSGKSLIYTVIGGAIRITTIFYFFSFRFNNSWNYNSANISVNRIFNRNF